MYINDRRRRTRMVKRRRGVLSGLGAASDCGAGQVWNPDYVFNGLPPGQCVTQAQSDAWYAANPKTSGSSGGSVADDIASSLSSLSKIFGTTQTPQAPMAVSTGPSTMEIVAIAGAGLLGIYLLTRK